MSKIGIYPQFIHSNQINVPEVTDSQGSEGQLLQLLDAVLINGTGEQTPIDTVIEDEFVRFIYGTPHKYMRFQFLQINGANDESLNGRHRVVKSEATSVWIDKNSVLDTTGNITTKIATIGENGWESIFGNQDPLQRAYRSKNHQGTRTVLYLDGRIQSTGQYNSTNPMKKYTVSLCRDMKILGEQIESYTDYENEKYVDGAFQWFQGLNQRPYVKAEGTVKSWVVFGDGDIFYLGIGFNSNGGLELYKNTYHFGDMPKLSNADLHNCTFSAQYFPLPNQKSSYMNSSASGSDMGCDMKKNEKGSFFIRDINGIGVLDEFKKYAMFPSNTPTARSGFGGLSPTEPLTRGLVFSDIFVKRMLSESAGGNLPYLKAICTNLSEKHLGNLDCSLFNDYFLYASACSSMATEKGQGYFAICLTEIRESDNA